MAARHDRRNRPVGNALLKWQLQQDQRRIAEVQRRLMRMAAPSPASSLGMDSINSDRRPTARRPRPMHREDPEEDALMRLIMEREQREAASSNQRERPGLKPSRLPPLKQNLYPKPPHNTPVKNVSLRPTGQKLNAAGDFYSPVRPREAALSSSSSEFRQNLAFSRIKAPAPKRLVGRTAAPSPRNPLRYDQMKTPDRWRTTAMRSNQEEFNESALKRWEQEDAMQADRLLEKAARDGDDEPLWGDLFYGTKAARAKTNQQQNDPEPPVLHSTSSFPQDWTEQPNSPLKAGINDSGMLPSDLSTMSTTKPSTVQHSDVGSRAVHSTGASPVTSGQSISELLASMEKSAEVEPSARELAAGDDRGFDGSGGGGDREQLLTGGAPTCEPQYAQSDALSSEGCPLWSVVVVASCLVVGTCGFFIEKLMGLLGFFSENAPLTLSRADQERMRDRVGLLQRELQGFQLSTSEIEAKSQTVVTELERHMKRMRLDREQHQNMLTAEMQELRSHVFHITQDIVEKERSAIQTQLEELVKVQVANEEKAVEQDDTAGRTGVGSAEPFEETLREEPAVIEPDAPSVAVHSVADPVQDKLLGAEEAQDEVASTHPAIAVVQVSTPDDDVQAHAGHDMMVEEEQELTPLIAEEPGPQVQPEDVKAERVEEVFVVPASARDQAVDEIDVGPAPKLPAVSKQAPRASGVSWEGSLLLTGIMFLVACAVLRVYNINRRKNWFEERRKRRSQRALRLAHLRAQTMASIQDDSDEWGSEESDSVEEVALMTPERDSEDDEALQRPSPGVDTDFSDHENEQTSHAPTEAYRVATSEVSFALKLTFARTC
jgi:hypothetical protein